MNSSKLLLSTLLLFFQMTVFGQTIILTLDSVSSNITCNQIWTEQNLDISFTPIDSMAGNCSFGVDSTSVWLYPAKLTVDLSSLENIQKVEVDILDNCGISCTQAALMDTTGMLVDSAGNMLIFSSETLTVENPSEEFLSELIISSYEGEIREVRIYQNITSTIQMALDDVGLVTYPNPSTSTDDLHFRIPTFSATKLPERIDIFSMNGKLIYSHELNAVTDIDSLSIPAKNLSKGIFFVRFKLGNRLFTQKIVRL